MILNNLNNTHPSWHSTLSNALSCLDQSYLDELLTSDDWLPGKDKLLNAFSIPKDQVKFILFGESPYPRAESANGYAFWDAAIESLWSETGLSKPVNRATSMRNIMKMLLIASDRLNPEDLSQPTIARLDKSGMVESNEALFSNLLNKGFLLLNATPVLRKEKLRHDAKMWQPFVSSLLHDLYQHENKPKLLLFGKIAEAIEKLKPTKNFQILTAEHPYNLSFAQNKGIIEFFRDLQLLELAK